VRPIDGPGHITLRQTGRLVELGTERAFGRLAWILGGGEPRRVLIGGLGFAATLRGVLEVVGPDARVEVVEKVRAVVALLRGPLASYADGALDDPRVAIVEGDVGEVIDRHRGDLDVVLLDVDNGPHWASFRSNARLYSPAGLASIKRALAPRGAVAVWSGYRADEFLGHLRRAGFTPSVTPLAEEGRTRARMYVGSL
jgi:spermidine synthase